MFITTSYDGVAIYRTDKVIYARFLDPHVVLFTCRVAVGMRNDLDFVLNHQACEPSGHCRAKSTIEDPGAKMRFICKAFRINHHKCAMMATAANIMNAAFVKDDFHGIEVAAVVMARVETNAGRAGDPASVVETEQGFKRLKGTEGYSPDEGTVNIMLFVGHVLKKAPCHECDHCNRGQERYTPGTLCELQVLCWYYHRDRTDQIIVAASRRGNFNLSWAGKHSKLGELIGTTVKLAVQKALKKQDGLTPEGQCSWKAHLERFGCDKLTMIEGIAAHLPPEQAILFKNNFAEINRHPLIVAQVATIAHLMDKFSWGVLPLSCWREIMGNAAAQIACSVSGRWERYSNYREKLGESAEHHDNHGLLHLCYKAFALGFQDKWSH